MSGHIPSYSSINCAVALLCSLTHTQSFYVHVFTDRYSHRHITGNTLTTQIQSHHTVSVCNPEVCQWDCSLERRSHGAVTVMTHRPQHPVWFVFLQLASKNVWCLRSPSLSVGVYPSAPNFPFMPSAWFSLPVVLQVRFRECCQLATG